MKHTKRISLCAIVLAILTHSSTAHAITLPSGVLCVKKGAIAVKSKCAKGEKRLSLANLPTLASINSIVVQGTQGPQGVQGPAGTPGAPGGFDFATCYSKVSPLTNLSSNAVGTTTVSCNSTSTQYMASSGFDVGPVGAVGNKPFLQAKDIILDPATSKIPVGVTYTIIQGVNTNNAGFSVQSNIICCNR